MRAPCGSAEVGVYAFADDAEFFAVRCIPESFGCSTKTFGGYAASVQAGASEESFLYKSNRFSLGSGAGGGFLSARPAADYNKVILFHKSVNFTFGFIAASSSSGCAIGVE